MMRWCRKSVVGLAAAGVWLGASGVRAEEDSSSAAAAESAAVSKKKKKPTPLTFLLGVGRYTNLGLRPMEGTWTRFEHSAAPGWNLGDWHIGADWKLSVTNRFGQSAGEIVSDGLLTVRTPRLWKTITPLFGAGYRYVVRPGWPDLYQPELDSQTGLRTDEYSGTDRYGYGRIHLDAGLKARLSPHWTLTAKYLYENTNGEDDPGYNGITRPNHLVPADYQETGPALGLKWETRQKVFSAGLQGGLLAHDDFAQYARDAGIGATHAGPGGAPPNPLRQLSLLSVKPSFHWNPRWHGLKLAGSFTWANMQDLYQGYDGYQLLRPALELQYTVMPRVTARVLGVYDRRDYGDNGYAAGSGHPPLDYGAVRQAEKIYVEAELAYRLKGLFRLAGLKKHLFVRGTYTGRRTNFPDYQPSVFQASQPYAVDMDLPNSSILAGIRVAP